MLKRLIYSFLYTCIITIVSFNATAFEIQDLSSYSAVAIKNNETNRYNS